MKSLLKVLLITGIAAISATGLSVGTYFVADTLAPKPGSDVVENPGKDLVVNFFAGTKNVATDGVLFNISDEDNSKKYISAGYAVQFEDDSFGFMYDLVNRGAEYDIISFRIGIKDATVVKYQFLDTLEGHGETAEKVEGKEMFVGYQLGGPDVDAGVTGDAYNSQKWAVDFALTDCAKRNAAEILGSGSTFTPSKYVTALFPDRTAVAEEFFTDFNDPKHVIYEASKVTFSDNTTGFYYLLQNYYPEYDSIKFAIGIIDNTVVGYKYVELIDGHGVGEEQVDGNKKIFIGYQLGGEDVYGGVTVMDTYDSMKVAIDIALADCQGR